MHCRLPQDGGPSTHDHEVATPGAEAEARADGEDDLHNAEEQEHNADVREHEPEDEDILEAWAEAEQEATAPKADAEVEKEATPPQAEPTILLDFVDSDGMRRRLLSDGRELVLGKTVAKRPAGALQFAQVLKKAKPAAATPLDLDQTDMDEAVPGHDMHEDGNEEHDDKDEEADADTMPPPSAVAEVPSSAADGPVPAASMPPPEVPEVPGSAGEGEQAEAAVPGSPCTVSSEAQSIISMIMRSDEATKVCLGYMVHGSF